MERLEKATGELLGYAQSARATAISNNDAFDAFICSLVARATALGPTIPPSLTNRLSLSKKAGSTCPNPQASAPSSHPSDNPAVRGGFLAALRRSERKCVRTAHRGTPRLPVVRTLGPVAKRKLEWPRLRG